MAVYYKFRLTPGQQPPAEGSTGMTLEGDWIVWIGEDGEPFPKEELINEIFDSTDVEDWNILLEHIAIAQPEEITLEEYKDSAMLKTKYEQYESIVASMKTKEAELKLVSK